MEHIQKKHKLNNKQSNVDYIIEFEKWNLEIYRTVECNALSRLLVLTNRTISLHPNLQKS